MNEEGTKQLAKIQKKKEEIRKIHEAKEKEREEERKRRNQVENFTSGVSLYVLNQKRIIIVPDTSFLVCLKQQNTLYKWLDLIKDQEHHYFVLILSKVCWELDWRKSDDTFRRALLDLNQFAKDLLPKGELW